MDRKAVIMFIDSSKPLWLPTGSKFTMLLLSKRKFKIFALTYLALERQ
jgi:hypothetical protein